MAEMDSNASGDLSRVVCTSEVAITTPAAKLLATGGVDAFCATLRPYALQAKVEPGVAKLRGHRLALELFARFVERLEADILETPSLGLDHCAALVRDFLDNQLKFDLAFRLQGVPKAVRPLNLAQVGFMNALLEDGHELLFGIGPTGTGKTHLALAAGLALLAAGKVQHLVVTRPIVLWEGEIMTAPRRADLVDEGQLTAVEDELQSLIGHQAHRRLVTEGKLELVPLGCLRGRTFNNSFILVDEAQNLLVHQMRMVLTRLGHASRMVILGDPGQIDLHGDELSGLPDILGRLHGRNLALVHEFRREEIVRNPLVAEIESLYVEGTSMPARRAA